MSKQRISSTVEIGAAVSGSFETATHKVRSNITEIGGAIRSVKKEQDRLGNFSGKGFEEIRHEFDALTAKAARLRKEYEQADGPTLKMRLDLEQTEQLAREAQTALNKKGAAIKVGAVLDEHSLKTASRAARGDFADIEQSIREVKSQQDKLERFKPQDVTNAGKEYRSLKREARKLREEYERTEKPAKKMLRQVERAERTAQKAGASYDRQRNSLNRLEAELKDAGVDTRRLGSENERLAHTMHRLQRRYERMQKIQERAGRMKAMVGQAARYTAVVGAGIGVAGAAMTMTNKLTAEQTALARALNVSADTFAAWGGIAKEMGFEADHVGDLIEEMNNKLGESAGLEETTPVKESLQILGLSFQELQDLKPEEQFRRIAQAIKGLDDHAQAVSAADILFGGEANKFFGYLRTRKEGVDELLARQRELNILSDKGRQGADAYNRAFGRLTTVVGSAAGEFSGLVGGAIAPLVNNAGQGLADWLHTIREGFTGVGSAVDFAARVGAWGALTAGIAGVAFVGFKAVRSMTRLGGLIFRTVGSIGRLGKLASGGGLSGASGTGAIPVRVVNLGSGGGLDFDGLGGSGSKGRTPSGKAVKTGRWGRLGRGLKRLGRVGKLGGMLKGGFGLVGKLFKPVGMAMAGMQLFSALRSGNGKNVGSGVGNIGGSMAGAAVGAALGSVVPVVGTAIGGILGSIFGGMGGEYLGGKVGSAFAAKNTEAQPSARPMQQPSGAVPALSGILAPALPSLAMPSPPAESRPVRIRMEVGGITINAAPGQSVEEISDAVVRKLEGLRRDAQRKALYDR